jgi:predicted RNase H-related nuclease YkuK (DUF458 family)
MGTNKTKMKYKRLYDKEELDLVSYVSDWLVDKTDIDILIGCDSQNHSDKTTYAIVVALYTKGKGAHVLYNRWKVVKEYNRSVRLLNEVWYAIEVAELLKENGIPKPKWIDIDINPDPKYKSNEVFRQAVGLVEGMGYKVRYKSLGPIATYAADHLVKM